MTYSVKISNYQCFGEVPQGFDTLKRMNVIVGRNNAGKSSLLDMIEFATRGSNFPASAVLHHRNSLTREVLAESFRPNVSGGEIRGDHAAFGRAFEGRSIAWTRCEKNSAAPDFSLVSVDGDPELTGRKYWENIAGRGVLEPLRGRAFMRLATARNVVSAEIGTASSVAAWEDSGSGVTQTLSAFIHLDKYPTEDVEVAVLERLNEIVGHPHFTRMTTMINGDNRWEVFLTESGKARPVPLSRSGAGLQTILCVLTMFELYPKLSGGRPLVYALEEVENSLHPSLQRRLVKYIREKSLSASHHVFIATHSPAIIDAFFTDNEAQIVHVSHDGSTATVRPVIDYLSRRSSVDDLGGRASDLLQANCVIWVEGPSDRVYVNRWIELWTNGSVREGVEYQCMFYGGSLLAHVSADDPLDPHTEADLVRLLHINRNAIVLLDSDASERGAQLNKSKMRVLDELSGTGGIGWVTDGREVENYIPSDLLIQVAKLKKEQVASPYTDVPTLLEESRTEYTNRYRRIGKVGVARDVCPLMTKEMLSETLDLAEKLKTVVDAILGWNSPDDPHRL